MNTLKSLIRAAKISRKESIASTIRLPLESNSFIEELAEYLSISKQEAMLKLIEAGISEAQTELKLNEVEESNNSSFHILNTNKRHSIDDHEWMINEGVAAAFYDPWKMNINRINENDIVYLYANGTGIVAYGKGTGETLVRDHNGDKGECHYQVLKDFKVLEQAMPAKDIKKTLNRNVVFLRTMSGMPDGEKVLNKILNG